jgi:hypothetical protein
VAEVNVITSLRQKGSNGWDKAVTVPIGTVTDYVFKGNETLTQILSDINTRLANIEACLKEVAQEDGLIFNDEDINPVG